MKKIYLLPNLVTTANLVCGFFSMVHAFQGEFQHASWFIIIAAICDSLDGRIARMAKATSSFGVQYDSLADLTSFGIAPAILLFSYSLHHFNNQFGVGVAAFYAVCAALRLARFNVSAEERDPLKQNKIRKGYFEGLPSPCSAGLVVTTVLMQIEFSWIPEEWMNHYCTILCVLLALLMVSHIPFPSFKEVNWRSKGKAWVLLIPIVFIISAVQAPALTFFVVGYFYLISALIWSVYLGKTCEKKSEITEVVNS